MEDTSEIPFLQGTENILTDKFINLSRNDRKVIENYSRR